MLALLLVLLVGAVDEVVAVVVRSNLRASKFTSDELSVEGGIVRLGGTCNGIAAGTIMLVLVAALGS